MVAIGAVGCGWCPSSNSYGGSCGTTSILGMAVAGCSSTRHSRDTSCARIVACGCAGGSKNDV